MVRPRFGSGSKYRAPLPLLALLALTGLTAPHYRPKPLSVWVTSKLPRRPSPSASKWQPRLSAWCSKAMPGLSNEFARAHPPPIRVDLSSLLNRNLGVARGTRRSSQRREKHSQLRLLFFFFYFLFFFFSTDNCNFTRDKSSSPLSLSALVDLFFSRQKTSISRLVQLPSNPKNLSPAGTSWS